MSDPYSYMAQLEKDLQTARSQLVDINEKLKTVNARLAEVSQNGMKEFDAHQRTIGQYEKLRRALIIEPIPGGKMSQCQLCKYYWLTGTPIVHRDECILKET